MSRVTELLQWLCAVVQGGGAGDAYVRIVVHALLKDRSADAQGGNAAAAAAAAATSATNAAAASEQDIDPLNISMACMLWAASIPNCGVMYDV